MNKIILPVITLISLILLYVLHIYAIDYFWYLHFPYFDIIMHILGGFCIAMSAYFVLKNPKYIIFLTVLAGIIWEIFEVYYDISGWPIDSLAYKIDTIKDILNDTLGAIFAWILIIKIKNK